MKTAIACAALAGAAWLLYALSQRRDEILIFAIVWTAMAAAYVPRVWRSRTET